MAYDQEDISLEELMGRFGFTPPGPKSVFLRLREAMAGHGVISTKHKELVALAVCITSRREDCVTEHVRQALRAGASRDEVLEVIGMAILMGGQRAIPLGSEAANALHEH